MVALEFELGLSEAKVCCLVTKLDYLPLEMDLEINMGEQSIPTEGNHFSKFWWYFKLKGGEGRNAWGMTKRELQGWEHGLKFKFRKLDEIVLLSGL